MTGKSEDEDIKGASRTAGTARISYDEQDAGPRPGHKSARVSGGLVTVASVLAFCALVIAIAALVLSLQNRRNLSQNQYPADRVAQSEPTTPGPINNATPALSREAKPAEAPTPWVDPSPVRSAVKDVDIDRELNLKLLHDPAFQRYPIDASANDSWVLLRGSVPTAQIRSRAESIAKSIPGVRGVRNLLTVEPVH